MFSILQFAIPFFLQLTLTIFARTSDDTFLCDMYFTWDGQKCIPCDQFCDCSISKKPLSCDSCYYPHIDIKNKIKEYEQSYEIGYKNGQECKVCLGNCSFCCNDETNRTQTCLKCLYGFGLNDNGLCELCNATLTNCQQCSNLTTCEQCAIGYTGSLCTPCNPECLTCDNTGKCIECAPQYYNSSGNCDPVPIPFCDAFEINNDTLLPTCTQCSDGYYKNADNCDQCSSDALRCDINRIIQCKPGFAVVPISDGSSICVIEDTSCRSQRLDGRCTSCYDGFYLNVGKCWPSKCTQLNQGSDNFPAQCDFCQNGTFLENFKCLKCALGCLSCRSMSNCSICDEGYYLDKFKCIPCATLNCSDCKLNYLECRECLDGYYLNETLNTCIQCTSNCLQCNETQCELCDSASIMYIDGTCSISAGCLESDGIKCKYCKQGFSFNNLTNDCDDCTLTGKCQKTCPPKILAPQVEQIIQFINGAIITFRLLLLIIIFIISLLVIGK